MTNHDKVFSFTNYPAVQGHLVKLSTTPLLKQAPHGIVQGKIEYILRVFTNKRKKCSPPQSQII